MNTKVQNVKVGANLCSNSKVLSTCGFFNWKPANSRAIQVRVKIVDTRWILGAKWEAGCSMDPQHQVIVMEENCVSLNKDASADCKKTINKGYKSRFAEWAVNQLAHWISKGNASERRYPRIYGVS